MDGKCLGAVIVLAASLAAPLLAERKDAPPPPAAAEKIAAFKTVNFGDALPDAMRALYNLGIPCGNSEEVPLSKLFRDNRTTPDAPETFAASPELSRFFAAVDLNPKMKLSDVRLRFLYKKPWMGSLPQTTLYQVVIEVPASMPINEALKKLRADYGQPKIREETLELPVFLKQLEMVPVKLGYIGYKFQIPLKIYDFRKGPVTARLVERLVRKIELVESPPAETEKINEEILSRLPNISPKHRQAIEKLRKDIRQKQVPVLERMVALTRAGEALDGEGLQLQEDALDEDLIVPWRVTKTDNALFAAFLKDAKTRENTLKKEQLKEKQSEKDSTLDF